MNEMMDAVRKSLGSKPVTLYTLFIKKNKCVIAASNMSTVVYCTYNKLDIKGNLEASHTSPFGSSSFPYHTGIHPLVLHLLNES